MSILKSDEELYRDFLRYLHERRKARRARATFDPFALLERLLAAGLRGMERVVARLVRAFIR